MLRWLRSTLSESDPFERAVRAASGWSRQGNLSLVEDDVFPEDDEPGAGTIALNDVSKALGRGKHRKQVLSNVNARFQQGRFYGVLGERGSGRSTLVSLLTGNSRADSGRIVHGMTVSWPMASREVFKRELSIRTNIRVLAGMYGRWPPDMMDAVMAIGKIRREDMDKPLRDVLDETQNRALAALGYALDFQCYVADENFCLGSKPFRNYMRELFEARRGSHSLVLVTRNVQSVRDLCDEAFVLEGGTLRAFARPGLAIRAFKGPGKSENETELDDE